MPSPTHSLLTLLKHRSVIRLFVEPLAIAIVLAFVVRAAVRVYIIPSASMSPTLIEGDHIIVTPYRFGFKPQRGDVIVFQSPRSAGELMVKRVIAGPADVVETRNGRVVIRDHTVPETYVAEQASTGTITPQIIPDDCYFVLGDNRADSLDSRSWGVLPRSAVRGRARMILWSSGAVIGNRESGVVAAAPSPTPDTRHPAPQRSTRLFKPIP